jgi:hypothetical protein
MNFEDLRDAWAKEPLEGGVIPARFTGKTTSALHRLRKNMRNEFVGTLVGLTLTLIFILAYSRSHLSVLALCAAGFLFVQTGYYFTRFILFYRRTERYDMGLLKNLRKFIYELELNMEVYKTYSFCVTPIACLLWIAIIDRDATTGMVRKYLLSDIPASPWSLLSIVITLLCIQFVGAFFLRLHMRMQYGRYLKELKRTLEDLEAEE